MPRNMSQIKLGSALSCSSSTVALVIFVIFIRIIFVTFPSLYIFTLAGEETLKTPRTFPLTHFFSLFCVHPNILRIHVHAQVNI